MEKLLSSTIGFIAASIAAIPVSTGESVMKTDASPAQNTPTFSTSLVANDADQAVSTSRIACASASRVSGAGGGAWLQPARMTARASAAGKEYRFYMVPSHGPSSISQRSYVRLQGTGTGHWNRALELGSRRNESVGEAIADLLSDTRKLAPNGVTGSRSEEHTSELQSRQ